MLSAFAVDALWRSCRSKLSTLLDADARREKKKKTTTTTTHIERGGGGGHFESTLKQNRSIGGGVPEEEEKDDDVDSSDEDDDDDALTLYLRYASILDDLNLCERSCVHPQKHRLIDRAMAAASFRAHKIREKEEEEDQATTIRTTTKTFLFDSETVDERSRHRNESKDTGEMVVPNRFWRERRGFLEREVKRVVDAATASTEDHPVVYEQHAAQKASTKDDGKESKETKSFGEDDCCDFDATRTEENTSATPSDDDDDDKSGDDEEEEEDKEDKEEDKEESKEDDVKQRRKSDETTTTTTIDEYTKVSARHQRLAAIVTIQRHARGCLERKKTRTKAEKELERLGMVSIATNDDFGGERKTTKTKTKTKKAMCIDSLFRSTTTTFAETLSDDVGESDFENEDISIETKIEAMREDRMREYRENQPRVYDRMKKELFEKYSKTSFLAFDSFVDAYRETHDGALPGLKDIFDDDDDDDDEGGFDPAAEGHEQQPRRRNTNVLQLPVYDNETDDDVNDDDDKMCGFDALRKILAASERAFPTTTTTTTTRPVSNAAAATPHHIDDIDRERRNTRFSEEAEKRAIEKDVLKEVSIEIEEHVKRALEEMRDAEEDTTKAFKTTTTTRDEENKDKDKTTTKTKKKKKKKTKKFKSKSKSTKENNNTCQKAMYDSIDAYPIVKYLLEHNVKIDSLCTKCNNKSCQHDDKKFIASSADEFVYGLPEEESSLAVKPDRSIDDQKRVIESIKSNVLVPLGASTSDAWLESYAQKKPPKHLLLIGPRGCGQKHFAKHVLARESGSVFFDASIENVRRRRTVRKDDDADDVNDDGELNNKTTSAKQKENEKEEEMAFCANVLKRTFQLAKKWAPSVVYVGNVENAFATGKEKKTSKKTSSKSSDKKKSKEDEEEDEMVDCDGTNTNEVTGCETNADAAVTQREEEQNIDPKSFKLALTAALKTLEKENGATINATRRVCVVASISDVSRLTKKDEKILLGKIFHSKAAFAAPFMRPSRAARYDLLKTFYREEVDKHIECTPSAALSSPLNPSNNNNNNLVRCVIDGARDEGALSELSHFAETCNRKVLTLCVQEGFRKAIESIQRRTTTPKTQTCGDGDGLSRVVVHPHLFTDAQRALVWRFASAALRRLRAEEEEKTPTKKKKRNTQTNASSSSSSFFVFAKDDDDDDKESSIRAFAKRVIFASSSSTKSSSTKTTF